MGVWAAVALLAVYQVLAAWWDKPPYPDCRATDSLRVTVVIPVRNEDKHLLDRAIWSIVNGSRQPDRIAVVDDGSDKVNYHDLITHWSGQHGRTEITWTTRPKRAGKKRAQAVAFIADPAADIFVTVDSDTILEYQALERGLTRFLDPEVMSVAGVELAYNGYANGLTRTVYARSLVFQLNACATQSLHKEVLVNRGTFALLRASLVRDVLFAYLNETFFGVPVDLGDDATLALFASRAGKAVQQSDAFCYTMLPETISHHLRQWTRWMRGATIRNTWRIKYIKPWQFGWLFTYVNLIVFVMSLLLPAVIAMNWSTCAPYLKDMLLATVAWSALMGLGTLAVKRSDENLWNQLITAASFLPASVWTYLVLRPLRLYGILTWYRQAWNTRRDGVEVYVPVEEAA